MNRRLVGVAVLCAWMVSMAAMLQRQVQPPNSSLAGLDERLPPGDAFLRLMVAGEQVGIFSTSLDTTASGVRTVERLDLAAWMGPVSRRITQGTDLLLDASLGLDTLRITRGGTGDRTRATMALDTAGGAYAIQWLAGIDTASSSVDRPSGPGAMTLATLIRWAGLQSEPTPGPTDRLLLDPMTMDWAEATIWVSADSVIQVPDSASLGPAGTWEPVRWDTLAARRVRLEAWGLPFEGTVDRNGNLVALSTPFGGTWERTAFEIVREGYEPAVARLASGPAPAPAAGRPAGDRTATAGGFRALLRRRDGTPFGSLHWLAGPGQAVAGDTVIVTHVSRASASSAEPLHLSAAWFRASPAHPAGDRRVQVASQRILRKGTDPASNVGRLLHWVRTEIRLDPDGPDNPLVALEHRRASPRGKVALLVTLARASGLAARPVAGLRLTPRGFEPWGWAEVGVPGWLPVDPVQGVQAGADRIRLAEGVPADPMAYVPLLGGVEATLIPETRP